MLILSNEDVSTLISIGQVIEALRVSNREIALFRGSGEYRLNRPRTNHYMPWEPEDDDGEKILASGAGKDVRVLYDFKSMEGGCLHYGVWALRSSSDLVRLETGAHGPTHKFLRYGDLPGRKGYSDLVFLYNMYDAQFEAIIQAAVLQGMRVAATSALGVDYLCRKDATKIGLFGSGWQAAANLRAILHVRPTIKQAYVFSPNPENRSRFARRMTGELRIEVQPVDEPRKAVLGMDLICEASSARTPVFDGALLEPGQHIVSVGAGDETFHRRLIDPQGVARCDVVAAHSLDVRYGLEEIEDCIADKQLSWDDVVDLPALVTGSIKKQVAGAQITFFKNNVGLGTQFAAVGGLALEKAKQAGIGFVVPQDRVSQVMSR